MMSRVVLLIGFLQLTLTSDAQVTGIRETGAIATVAGDSTKTREWRNTITNISNKEIVAIHVTFLCTLTDGYIQSDDNGSKDNLLRFRQEPLAFPGEVFVAKAWSPGDCSSRTDAVVYANNTVEGDEDTIAMVFGRREAAYRALSIVIPLLDEVASGKSSVADVIRVLRTKRLEPAGRKPTEGEATADTIIFGGTIGLLENHAWLETPSDRTESRQRPIEELMKTKGMSLEQAHALVTANKYREWRAALEGHTTPPN
jgi:hypothetical protein